MVKYKPMHNEKAFKKGSYVFIEKDENCSTVFLVKEGRVSHFCSSPVLSSALKDAMEGDFFGFISSFSMRPRMSSAVAVEDSVVIEIEREKLFLMLNEKTEIALKIMNSYSHALKHYNSVLLDIKPISLIYPQNLTLMRLGEFYMDKGENNLANYIFNRYIQLFPDSENILKIESYINRTGEKTPRRPFTENEKGELMYRNDSVIFCEHEPGDFLYFIREGKVKIMKQSSSRNMLIAVLKEGDIFGELALITSSPRSATAVSFGGTTLIPVDMIMFRNLLTESPDLIKKILTSISQRLWFNHLRLSLMSYKNPVTRLFSFLESKLLEENISLSRKKPHQFQFGLDELIEMNELSAEKDQDAINELVNNRLLSFNFGTITISNPAQFASVIQMYKQRDRFPVKQDGTFRGSKLLNTPCENRQNVKQENFETPVTPDESIHPSGFEDDKKSIIPDLESENFSIKASAVIRLGNLGERAREFIPRLQEMLGDKAKILRKNAVRSITRILPQEESFRIFSESLTDNSQEIRSSAITGLGELNFADKSVLINLMVKALDDESPLVRSSAVRNIASFGADAEYVSAALLRLLTDSETSVRILTISALERIVSTKEYLELVITKIQRAADNDTDKFVQSSAMEVLIKLNRRKKHA